MKIIIFSPYSKIFPFFGNTKRSQAECHQAAFPLKWNKIIQFNWQARKNAKSLIKFVYMTGEQYSVRNRLKWKSFWLIFFLSATALKYHLQYKTSWSAMWQTRSAEIKLRKVSFLNWKKLETIFKDHSRGKDLNTIIQFQRTSNFTQAIWIYFPNLTAMSASMAMLVVRTRFSYSKLKLKMIKTRFGFSVFKIFTKIPTE